MNKPDWMSQDEYDAQMRHTHNELTYNVHNASLRTRKWSSIGAGLIVAGMVAAILAILAVAIISAVKELF